MEGSVYRHLDRRWMQEFFANGSLLLTTLPRCREHELSSRKDARDGKVNFSISDGEQMVAGISTAGQQSYILCASSSNDAGIQERFGTDSWIEIFDVAGFASAVAQAIGSAVPPLIAACQYVDDKEINWNDPLPASDALADLQRAALGSDDADINAELEQFEAQMGEGIGQLIGDDVCFIKNRAYEVEGEVRFVWRVDHAVDGPRSFQCPDARQFCKPGP